MYILELHVCSANVLLHGTSGIRAASEMPFGNRWRRYAEGIEQGIEQGFFDGSHQKALETAKNLLGLGLSIENIAQATGLTKAEVESI